MSEQDRSCKLCQGTCEDGEEFCTYEHQLEWMSRQEQADSAAIREYMNDKATAKDLRQQGMLN